MRISPPRVSSMTVGLAIGTTLAAGLAAGGGAYLYSVRHTRSVLAQARETARTQGDLIRAALEYQMLQNDRTLIGQMIDTFGRQPNAEQVALLDREGHVRFQSAPMAAPGDFSPGSPTCQTCHQYPPSQRMDSHVIETQGGAVLRTVIPIRNRSECHECHDPSDRINGVLMFDMNVAALRAGVDRDLRWMAGTTAVLTLLLIAGIAVVIRLVVMRRLQRFEQTARSIAGGDLKRRVPAEGADTVSWLARAFNTMADSMTHLIDQVQGQQNRLEAVINSIDDGIVVLDPARGVLAANDGFLRRTGHARSQVVGLCCHEVGPGACPASDCPTLACLATGERQVRIVLRPGVDGEGRWEEVHASPMLDASGRVTQVVEVWRDISDRRAAEARLSESHRLASLGMLASGFSHELNTPLATVLTCVEGILRESAPAGATGETSPITQRASTAREQVLRCRGITQHFLRLSRGQASHAEIVEVERTVSEVIRLIEPTARAHSVRVAEDRACSDVHVRTDDAELQHVLINLVLNAIQASRPGAEVRVQVVGGDPVRIRVIDHGCGISTEDQRRIFDPFVSLRSGGTGLGLFLSWQFARRWGGDITVTSQPGAGSVFDVLIPAASPASARSA